MTTIKTKGKVSDLDSCEIEDKGKGLETLTKERWLGILQILESFREM